MANQLSSLKPDAIKRLFELLLTRLLVLVAYLLLYCTLSLCLLSICVCMVLIKEHVYFIVVFTYAWKCCKGQTPFFFCLYTYIWKRKTIPVSNKRFNEMLKVKAFFPDSLYIILKIRLILDMTSEMIICLNIDGHNF